MSETVLAPDSWRYDLDAVGSTLCERSFSGVPHTARPDCATMRTSDRPILINTFRLIIIDQCKVVDNGSC